MISKTVGSLHLDPAQRKPLLKTQATASSAPSSIPTGKKHTHPSGLTRGNEDASITFIGNATVLLEWNGIRILTDPNFLHAGDHVHLGPGVTAKRLRDPHVDLHQLPPLDCILLSHYHEDHFDRLVEDALNRDFDIITTPHAKECLTLDRHKEDPFRAVHGLDFFQSLMMHVSGERRSAGREPVIKVTATPGKHVPPGPLSVANDLLGAVPPTNGWIIELGFSSGGLESDEIETGYRIYISGDTLFVDELKEIPDRLKNERIDLMLVHLGGTTIPGPSLPMLMVTMDAKQGLQLMQLMNPNVTIPIHFDDYDVMLSSLDDFKAEVGQSDYAKSVVYLDRGEQYWFRVRD